MPSYKLHYFNAKGRAEGIRMLLTYAGQDFEDRRIEMADWPAAKKDFTYGQTPALEVDGQQLCQTKALFETAVIYRYLGAAHGLVPSDTFAAAKVSHAQCRKSQAHHAVGRGSEADEVASSVEDLMGAMQGLFALKEDKAKLRTAFEDKMANVILPRLQLYEDFLKAQKSGFLAETVSWADFAFWNGLAAVAFFVEPDMDRFPSIKAFMAKVEGLDKVKEWVAEHNGATFTPMMPRGLRALIE